MRVTNIAEHLDMKVSRMGGDLSMDVTDAAEHLRMTCTLVCDSVGSDKYLNVAPTVIWLIPEMLSGGEFNVYSNVDWLIN